MRIEKQGKREDLNKHRLSKECRNPRPKIKGLESQTGFPTTLTLQDFELNRFPAEGRNPFDFRGDPFPQNPFQTIGTFGSQGITSMGQDPFVAAQQIAFGQQNSDRNFSIFQLSPVSPNGGSFITSSPKNEGDVVALSQDELFMQEQKRELERIEKEKEKRLKLERIQKSIEIEQQRQKDEADFILKQKQIMLDSCVYGHKCSVAHQKGLANNCAHKIFEKIEKDMEEHSSAWPISCYSLSNKMNLISGDISFEEMRCLGYMKAFQKKKEEYISYEKEEIEKKKEERKMILKNPFAFCKTSPSEWYNK